MLLTVFDPISGPTPVGTATYASSENGKGSVKEESGTSEVALTTGPALLIAFSPTVRDVARRLLEKTGHPNEAFSSLDDATVWLITHDVRPEFVAIDLSDYDGGVNWIDDMRTRCGNVPCLCFTNGEEYEIEGNTHAYLPKPFDLDMLTGAMNELNIEIVHYSAA